MSDQELQAAIRSDIDRLCGVAQILVEVTTGLAVHLSAVNTAHVNEVDALHREIEEASRRWWHRPLGLTKEVTGWRFGPVRDI